MRRCLAARLCKSPQWTSASPTRYRGRQELHLRVGPNVGQNAQDRCRLRAIAGVNRSSVMADDVVIVAAARTPVGSFNGAFANLPAHELGQVAIKAALERAGVEGKRVSEVIMGQILSAGEGQNPARQASIAAGIPVESPAWGVNQLCGSGLRAVALGYQAIVNG